MNNKQQDRSCADKDFPASALTRNWIWTLIFGIALVILGVIGLYLSVWVTLASVMVFGAMLIAAAVMHGIESFRKPDHRKGSRLENILMAAMYLAMGGYVLIDPLAASIGLTLVLGAVFAAIGVTRLVYAWQRRDRKTEALLHVLTGGVALIMAAIILMEWPVSGLWVIGLLTSVELIQNGWLLVFAALALRRIQQTHCADTVETGEDHAQADSQITPDGDNHRAAEQ